MVAVLGGSRRKAIYHVPLLLALSLEEQAGTCVHELPTLPPTKPSLPDYGELTRRRENVELEYKSAYLLCPLRPKSAWQNNRNQTTVL